MNLRDTTLGSLSVQPDRNYRGSSFVHPGLCSSAAATGGGLLRVQAIGTQDLARRHDLRNAEFDKARLHRDAYVVREQAGAGYASHVSVDVGGDLRRQIFQQYQVADGE